MLNIRKRYIVDEDNKRLAVEIDYNTFQKIEEVIEDYALHQLILESENSESLPLAEAKRYYHQLLDKDGDQI